MYVDGFGFESFWGISSKLRTSAAGGEEPAATASAMNFLHAAALFLHAGGPAILARQRCVVVQGILHTDDQNPGFGLIGERVSGNRQYSN